MSTIIDLGKITYVNKKRWTSTTVYEAKDVVSYNGSSWASLIDNNVNNEPVEGTYWTLMSKSTYQSWLDQGNTGTEAEFIRSITHKQPDWSQTITDELDYIKNKPVSLPANGGNSTTVNGHTVNSDVPTNAKFTDTIYSHPTTAGNKHIPAGGSTGQILRWSSDGTAIWSNENDSTYDIATTTKNGLMSKEDKNKIDGIASGANKYIHPSYSPKNSGIYKITIDNSGHVSASSLIVKRDITDLGIPAQDTIYSHPSFSARTNGLYKITINNQGHVTDVASVTKEDITALGIPEQDTVYTLPIAETTLLGGIKLGYTTSGKNYKLQVDSSGNAYVNVPWTDYNTTYTTATADELGLVKIGYTTNGKNYPVVLDTNGKMYVSVPWTDTNTVYTHPTSAGNKHIPSGGSSGQILRWSADGTAVWGADNNTTYSTFKAATSSAAGGAGLVPAPAAGKHTSFLRGDGTWVIPANTTYGLASTTANGLLKQLPNNTTTFMRGDGTWATPPNTVYTHPTTAGNKHIPAGGASGQILRWSADGTAVWGSDNNTTYGVFKAATSSAAGGTGLVPAPAAGAQAKYLRADGTWQTPPDTKYAHPTGAGNNHIPAGGAAGQILRWSAAGVAVWGADNNTTYGVVGGNGSTGLVKNGSAVTSASGYTACPIVGGVPYYKDTNTTYAVATTSANGLMSSADKTKLNACPTATGLTKIQKITQSAYDALSTKDANTLYIIVG